MAFVKLLMVLLATYHVVDCASIQNECERDHQCPSGQYCYLKSGYCVKCINCNDYNRINPEHLSCHKNPEDCGDCLPHYNKVPFTERDVFHCLRDNSVEKNGGPSKMLIIGVVAGLFLTIIFIVTLTYLRRRKHKGQNETENGNNSPEETVAETDESSRESMAFSREQGVFVEHDRNLSQGKEHDIAPPPYSIASPSAPLLEVKDFENCDGDTRGTVELHYVSEKEKSCLEGAIPFRRCKYDSSDSESEEDSNHFPYVDEEGTASDVWASTLQDEDTMPSEWTPTPHYGDQFVAATETTTNGNESQATTAAAAPQEQTNSDLNDSGDSGVSLNVNIDRPFANLRGLSENATSIEEERGVTRSLSEEDVGTPGPSCKRQRHDSGTHSLEETSSSDAQIPI